MVYDVIHELNDYYNYIQTESSLSLSLSLSISSLMLKHITTSLSDILYKCETWSLTKREENRMLRRIFGPKMEEVAGGWRRLHNEELHNLYASPNIVKCDQVKEDGMGG
jgi:hypothetical protein